MARQNTIQGPAMCAGVGVHSGARARLVLHPAPAGSGIVFVRSDIADGRDARIPAHADFVATTAFGTTLRNADGVQIATVEHLLAACAGLEIDNLLVEVDGPEVPILDGSAAPFVSLLVNAGIRELGALRRFIRMLAPVSVTSGEKWAALLPDEDPAFEVTIRYGAGPIGVQRKLYRPGRDAFLNEIAPARTYGFLADLDRLHAAGLGRGADYSNTVVIDQGAVVNEGGLRFADEFVRHKILDAIGDLALAGAPIIGRFVADRTGHELNLKLVQALLEARSAWCWETATAPSFAAVG